MSIIVPFNFQPVSVDVKTGTYTVPTGFYAFVTAYSRQGAQFFIDGTIALNSVDTGSAGVDFSVIAVAVNNVSSSNTYTVPTGYYFQGQTFTTVGSPEVLIGGQRAPNNANIYASSGQVISSNSPGDVFDLTGVAIRNSSPNDFRDDTATAYFWVPEGTLMEINVGSGTCGYTVALYNNIT